MAHPPLSLSSRLRQILPNLQALTSWSDVHDAVERVHGRRIVVGPAPKTLGPMVTGVWLQTDQQSYIFHDGGCVQSSLFVRHIVAHEYGHILLRHHGCELSVGTAFSAVGKSRSVEQILARSEQWTPQEREAEAIAVALSTHLSSKPDPVAEMFG